MKTCHPFVVCHGLRHRQILKSGESDISGRMEYGQFLSQSTSTEVCHGLRHCQILKSGECDIYGRMEYGHFLSQSTRTDYRSLPDMQTQVVGECNSNVKLVELLKLPGSRLFFARADEHICSVHKD